MGTSPNFVCSTTPGTSVDQFGGRLTRGVNTTTSGPFDSTSARSLFALAFTLQNKILLWLLVAAGCTFVSGLFSLIFLKRRLKANAGTGTKGRTSFLEKSSLSIAWTSAALALAATISSTQTTSALQFATSSFQSPVVIRAGTAVQVLQWLVSVLSVFFALGLNAILSTTPASGSGSASQSLPPLPPLPSRP